MFVDNEPGAAGNIAMQEVANSKLDMVKIAYRDRRDFNILLFFLKSK